MKQSQKTILLWLFLILMFVGIYKLFTGDGSKEEEKDVPWLQAELSQPDRYKDIDKVEVQPKGRDDARYIVTYKNSNAKTVIPGPYSGAGNEITKALDADKISWNVRSKEESAFWQTLIVSWLPMLFLFVIFFFFMRQLQAGGGKAMSFGKSKAKLLTDHQNKVTFEDVAGIDEAKDEVEEIIAFLKDPKKFTRLGGRIPKGVLMMGPPGTGKTLLARAIAGEAGVPFFSISGSDFVEMFVGVGAWRVRDLFEQGKKNAPCIIFIDEIDAVGRHRGAGLGGGHDEREQTLNQLLVEMDGFESNDGVILIAATNRPDVLDPALLRPGRFDRRIVVPRPDLSGRIGILQVHTRKVPLSSDVDLEVIARGTPGFSGADLENLVNEAALLAARRDKERVEMIDFEDAKDKVLMGSERRSMIISEKEKRTTAYHEAGHALVALLVGEEVDPVHKVTIIPRGRALGLTQQLPDRGPAEHDPRLRAQPHLHHDGRPLRRGSGVLPAHHRRRQRHRAGDRAGPQDGHRVGHERRHRSAQLLPWPERSVPGSRLQHHRGLQRGDRPAHRRRDPTPGHRAARPGAQAAQRPPRRARARGPVAARARDPHR